MIVDELHPIRLFYRRHLQHYAWARRVKPFVVTLFLGYIHARNIAVWRIHHELHVFSRSMSQRAKAASNYFVSKIYRYLKVISHRLAAVASSGSAMHDIYYVLVTFDEYRTANNSTAHKLTEAETFPIAIPGVYPEEYRKNLYSNVWPLAVPSVQAIEVSNVEVMGKCDFIFSDPTFKCLHHGLYRFKHDLPMEEMHGMVSINAKKNLLVRYNKKHQEIQALPAAISMIGSASSNYVHWLTETAPKLALLDQLELYADLPLIIDAELHPNILESLHCLNSRKRKLIPIKRGQICHVDKLVVITAVAYIPFEFRRGRRRSVPEIHPGLAMYVPQGLNLLRQKSVSHFVHEKPQSSTRLYLRRSAKSRRMVNAVEVETFMQEQGFQIIEPDSLTFAEQVKLFRNAQIIVGQGGAAFGNMIFAPSDCHIVILTTWTPFTIYYYFSNLAAVLGQRCSFVLCDRVEEPDSFHPAHKGLKVDLHNLKKAIGL